jgi:site-specific DNA-methyltransferase (adenine-specific)
MNKKWDVSVPKKETWEEVYRVLKPGAHLIAFFSNKTYHRGVVEIEDAGFEIRDMLDWIYGSGFPKSHDISKDIDKIEGVEREIIGYSKGKTGENLNKLSRPRGNDSDLAKSVGAYGIGAKQSTIDIPITKAKSETAKKWEGYGTNLKPAKEPMVLARKPISEDTIAKNVIKWGTGAINIDDCRIGDRFPSNVLTDGSEEVLSKLPKGTDSFFYSAKTSTKEREDGLDNLEEKFTSASEFRPNHMEKTITGETTGTAYGRFTKRKNNHPTVKPVSLMEYLVTLVTPQGGKVIDPYMGSGSTGIAAINKNFDFVGIEIDENYYQISKARIEHAEKNRPSLKKFLLT